MFSSYMTLTILTDMPLDWSYLVVDDNHEINVYSRDAFIVSDIKRNERNTVGHLFQFQRV